MAASRPACLPPLQVVHAPGSRAPAMLLTTAAVHSGASGGAVLDAASGALLGLVTSNAKHSSRASSASDWLGGAVHGQHTILPHINFSIPAAQLRPVVAAAAPGAQSAAAALAAWQALDAETAASAEFQQVWRLGRHQRRPAEQEQAGRQHPEAGALGGARPPAKMQQLLEQLQRQQQQQQHARARL